MNYLDNCKGCRASVRLVSEDIKRIIDEVLSSGNFNIVEQELYNRRLSQCSSCKHLQYDTTCMHCGCIVQVRALLEDKSCPLPGKNRW